MINKKTIKKSIILFFVSFFFSLQLDAKMFLGSIFFPVEVYPSLRLYYKGQKLILDARSDQEYKKISFTLDESPQVHAINILICEDSCLAKNNNIKHLAVSFSVDYKFYTLQGTRYFNDKGEEVLNWKVVEKKLDENIIPNNTLIFIFDPKLVENLRVFSWKKGGQVLNLPEIVMKKSVNGKILKKEDFNKAMNIACLSALELDSYHRQAGSSSIQKSQIVVKFLNKS